MAPEHQRFIDLLFHLQIALFLKDSAGRYVSINAAGAQILDQPISEILGKDDYNLFDMETANRMRRRDFNIARRSDALAYHSDGTLLGQAAPRSFFSIKFPLRMGRHLERGLLGVSFLRSHDSQPKADVELLVRELINRKASTLIEICQQQSGLYGLSVQP